MTKLQIPQKITAILVYGRPPLVFGGMLSAIAVMSNRSPNLYVLGVALLFVSMSFDLVDGWFAARFRPHATLAHLADRIMDKVVFSIIFPLVSVGMMWRVYFSYGTHTKAELLHAIFVLILCVTVLIRDNFANFMRGFALRKGQEPEPAEFTRLRTVVAAPVGALLYAYAFYVPEGPPSPLYGFLTTLGNIPLRGLFGIEILFLIINLGSIAGYCRKYGRLCLDELCLGDEPLRRRILAFFPNALTVMNAMMGLLAVFFAYQGRMQEAYLMLMGAAMFDKLDGALARKLGLTDSIPEEERGHNINLGSILDDISDAVSFCVAPAWIFYLLLSDFQDPLIQSIPLGLFAFLYCALGVSRLVYFTIDRTPVPGFFKGLPTPAAALFVAAPLIMFMQAVEGATGFARFWAIFCCILMVFAAIMMNLYFIRYLHLGRFMGRHPWFSRIIILLALVFVFTPYFGYILFSYLFLYLLSPIVTHRIDPEIAARETKTAPLTS
jgi:phosphatidylserine synthase